MNKLIVQSVITELTELLGGKKPEEKEFGLCHNYLDDISTFWLHKTFMKWGEFSGNTNFPVGTFSETVGVLDAIDMYYDTEDLYDRRTKYGKARYRLAEYIRDELIKELGRSKD